jgi:hypothetical protein
MAEFHSIFAGQEVDRAITKLKKWAAAGFDVAISSMTTDDAYDTVTINSVSYAVLFHRPGIRPAEADGADNGMDDHFDRAGMYLSAGYDQKA